VTEAIGDGPAAVAGDVADRIELSARRTADSAGATAVVLGSLAILAAVAVRGPRDPVLDAFLAGIAVSLVVNDTPSDVAGIGAAIAIALARHPPTAAALDSAPMRRPALLLLAALGLGLGVAACGGGEEVSPTPETVVGSLPAETSEGPTSTLEGDASNGESVFASAGCGGCHTMEAAGSSGSVGPNLDDAKPDFDLVVDRVTNGAGAMPAFEGQLSEQEIADVAAYVVDSTSG
jgi:mono/diheme cytochrome c family protein